MSIASGPSPSTWLSDPAVVVTTGASLTAATVMSRVAGALVPPSPSVSTKRAVRVAVDGFSDTLR